MADMVGYEFFEAEFARLVGATGEVGRYIIGLGDQVRIEAIGNATHRPGPRIRTGDLIESVDREIHTDRGVLMVDIGSPMEHRGYPYPSRLETGEDGQLYPWLRPALERVIARN